MAVMFTSQIKKHQVDCKGASLWGTGSTMRMPSVVGLMLKIIK